MSSCLRFALALLSCAQVSLGAYNLVKDYSGQTFFDSWTYYGNYDNLTNGTHLNRSLASCLTPYRGRHLGQPHCRRWYSQAHIY